MNPTQEYRFNECSLRTYDEAKNFFARGRTPDKGRHLKGWARVHAVNLDDGQVAYEVRGNGKPIVRFLPDNTLEFVCTPLVARETSITLSQALQRAVPFYWIRVATGRYRVQHIKQMKYNESKHPEGHWWEDGQHLRTKAPEFFQGIKFNLDTGECLNRKPDLIENINTDMRKKWLSDLRKFKKQIAVRVKMGVFDAICQAEYNKRMADRKGYQMPDWTSDMWINKLADSIKTCQLPMELLTGIVQTCRISYWSPSIPTRQDVLDTFETICRDQSIYLRKAYGVFDEPKTEQPSS